MRPIYISVLATLLLIVAAVNPATAVPGYHINSDKSAKQAVQQYADNNLQFDAVVYQAYLDKNLWRLALAAHAYLLEKPNAPERECSFAQAYWKAQQPGAVENVPPAAAKQLRAWFDEAVRATEDAVKKMPNSVYANLTYGHYLQYYVMGMEKVPKMLHAYQRAVAIAPKLGYAHYQLAMGYFSSGDDSVATIDKIIAEAKKAVALDARLTESYFWIACVYDWPGKRNRKISKLYLDKYIQAHPDQASRPDIVALQTHLKKT